jgi:hypothetical protein
LFFLNFAEQNSIYRKHISDAQKEGIRPKPLCLYDGKTRTECLQIFDGESFGEMFNRRAEKEKEE